MPLGSSSSRMSVIRSLTLRMFELRLMVTVPLFAAAPVNVMSKLAARDVAVRAVCAARRERIRNGIGGTGVARLPERNSAERGRPRLRALRRSRTPRCRAGSIAIVEFSPLVVA